MMMFSIACSSQDKNYVNVHRDSLYNILLNVSELKVENFYLRKKSLNQKLIIEAQDIIIENTEIETNILTQQIKIEADTNKKKWWDGFGKGAASVGVIVLGLWVSSL